MEVDKRVSKGFNTVEIDPALVEEILHLHLQEETSEPKGLSRLYFILHPGSIR